MSDGKRRIPKPLAWVLKGLVAAACLYMVFQKVPWSDVGPALRRCNFTYVLLSILITYAVVVANALRWKALFRRPDMPLRKFLYFVFLGQFFNLFLPTSVAAEALKVLAFGRKYGSTQENIGIALLTKTTGMAIQLLMGGIGLLLYAGELGDRGLFGRIRPGTASILGLSAAILVGGAAVWWFRHSLKAQTWFRTILEISRDRRLVASTVFWTALIQLLAASSSYCLFLSLWPDTRFWEVVLFTTIILGALTLPLGFGGVGVREYLNLLMFTDVGGIPAHVTFAVSMVGYIPILCIALTGGAWMLFRKFKS